MLTNVKLADFRPQYCLLKISCGMLVITGTEKKNDAFTEHISLSVI